MKKDIKTISLHAPFLCLLVAFACSKDAPVRADNISIAANVNGLMLEFKSTADGNTIPVYVAVPPRETANGEAVVLLHGSGGPWDDDDTDGDGIADVCNVGQLSRQNKEWRDLLVGNGFVVAFPDSYSPRNTCENEGEYKEPPLKFAISGTFIRNHDANGTLELLSKLVWDGSDTKAIDISKVALLGFSDGGTAVISTLYDQSTAPPSWVWKQSFSGVSYTTEVKSPPVPKLKFKTGIAYYPGAYHNGYYGNICSASGVYQSYCEIEFHLADKDPLSENAECLIETMQKLGGGKPTTYHYANVGHGFDGEDEPESSTARTRSLNFILDKLQ